MTGKGHINTLSPPSSLRVKDNNWSANLADMQYLKKGFVFYYVLLIF